MGNMQADAYAEGVREGWAPVRMAIAANLQSNHYPPIPGEYVDPVIAAIDAANEGLLHQEIDLNAIKETGMIPRLAQEDEEGNLTISAANLLEITHCWGFINDEDEEPDADEDWDLDGPAHVRED